MCIVGSGPAGASLGLQLARSGVRTLIVEAGANAREMVRDGRYALLGHATTSGDLAYPVLASRMMMMPGGTSAIWTGNAPRLLAIDFERTAYTPEGAPWPIDYWTLEPWFVEAEALLRVGGESDAPYAAPRSRPLPREARNVNLTVKSLLRAAGVVGVTTFRSRSMHARGPVRIARDVLPWFARLPGAMLMPRVTARRLLVAGGTDELAGVLLEDLAGRRRLVRARAYVLAAGGIECARRLLLCRSARFPDGIGNAHGLVGAGFTDHLIPQFIAQLTLPRPPEQPLPQTVRCFQFYESFKRAGLGSLYLSARLDPPHGADPQLCTLALTADCELFPSVQNRVSLDHGAHDAFGDPVAHLHLHASAPDRATLRAARAVARDIFRRIGAVQVEELPLRWGYHHIGTVRMGRDPATSVVDANLRVHGLRNLFLVTSGNLVTSGPANPTLLIVALAQRLARHLLGRLHEGSLEAPGTTLTAGVPG